MKNQYWSKTILLSFIIIFSGCFSSIVTPNNISLMKSNNCHSTEIHLDQDSSFHMISTNCCIAMISVSYGRYFYKEDTLNLIRDDKFFFNKKYKWETFECESQRIKVNLQHFISIKLKDEYCCSQTNLIAKTSDGKQSEIPIFNQLFNTEYLLNSFEIKAEDLIGYDSLYLTNWAESTGYNGEIPKSKSCINLNFPLLSEQLHHPRFPFRRSKSKLIIKNINRKTYKVEHPNGINFRYRRIR